FEIEEWLHQFPKTGDPSLTYVFAEKKEEVQETFHKWLQRLPEEQKQTFLDVLDQLIIQLANFLQKGSKSLEVEQKILVEGRMFEPELHSITDMQRIPFHQLEYIEEKF